MGGSMAKRYLAVAEMPQRNWLASITHRSPGAPVWHAVVETFPKPIKTLCGLTYTAEAHRTWDQTMSRARCPHCERLSLISAEQARGPTFIAEQSNSPGRA
jgi:hypothetical protein